MPRGQKKGWQLRQVVPKTPPATRTKLATGVWMTPHGTFDAYLYHLGKSVFLGAFPTIEEAVQARETRMGELEGGAPLLDRSASRVTFGEFAEKVYFPEAMVGRKNSTIRAAQSRLRQHLAPALGDRPLRDVTYERLSRLRATLLERKVSGQTKREALLLLRSILQEAVKRGILPRNPAALLDLPPKHSRQVRVPTFATARAVVDGIAAPGPRAAAEVLLQTGMRLNECLALQWSDIDLDARRIRVERSIDQVTGELVSPKTERGKRHVVIPDVLAAVLEEYRKLQGRGKTPRSDPWVFPTVRVPKKGVETTAAAAARPAPTPTRPPILNDRNFVQRHWEPALKAVEGADFTPHALRHLYASRLLTQGAPVAFVADQLGHSSPAFTYRQYVHFLEDRPEQAKEYVNGAFALPALSEKS